MWNHGPGLGGREWGLDPGKHGRWSQQDVLTHLTGGGRGGKDASQLLPGL